MFLFLSFDIYAKDKTKGICEACNRFELYEKIIDMICKNGRYYCYKFINKLYTTPN